jgi:formate dehydrogenase maturation protein FdhE
VSGFSRTVVASTISNGHETWDRRISRADQLAGERGPAASLLTFYARLLRRQRDVYDAVKAQALGALDRDLPHIAPAASALLREVAGHGPDSLAADARTLLATGEPAVADLLSAYWREPGDRQFFAKAILQPYAQCLAEPGVAAARRALPHADNRCPRCGGAPQLSILDSAAAGQGDGGSRQLLCATCLTAWPFRRVLCPHCGEGDERKLGYYHSQTFDHVRVDACESCHHYVKSIDLARLGLAVPIVDEVAGAALDLWARDHGFEKVELNLVGL